MNITTIKGAYALKETDTVAICDSAVGIAVTLKSSTGDNSMFYIKNIGAGNVTLTASLPDLIDGAATLVLAQYDSATLLDYKAGVWVKL